MKRHELLYDPQEDDPELGPKIRQAEKEAEAELAEHNPGMGFCHLLWFTQKEILKRKHEIDWKTPAEMNPNCIFD